LALPKSLPICGVERFEEKRGDVLQTKSRLSVRPRLPRVKNNKVTGHITAPSPVPSCPNGEVFEVAWGL
jgi:hypothetical protein